MAEKRNEDIRFCKLPRGLGITGGKTNAASQVEARRSSSKFQAVEVGSDWTVAGGVLPLIRCRVKKYSRSTSCCVIFWKDQWVNVSMCQWVK